MDWFILPALLALIVAARLIFGPIIWFKDEMHGRNGHHTFFTVVTRRGPLQAAVFAQELWESPRVFLRIWPGYSRRAELFSHEVEVQAAALIYGANADDYRRQEAKGMTGYRALKGMSPETIEIEMRKQAGSARTWVEAHARKIRWAKDQ